MINFSMIHTVKLVLFITFLVLTLLSDKIFGKNKKIWKIVFAILTAATALSLMSFFESAFYYFVVKIFPAISVVLGVLIMQFLKRKKSKKLPPKKTNQTVD